VIADRRPLVAAQLAPVEAAEQRDAQCAVRSALPCCIVAHLDPEPSRKATRPRDREAVCGAAWRAGTHGPNASAAGLDTPWEIVRSTYVPPGGYSVTVLLLKFET
jgi:hypothetical protein